MPPGVPDNEPDRTVVVRPSPRESTLQPGTKILSNTYVIDACLGKGGMGEVYKAEHIDFGNKRAIKIILPEYSKDPQFAELFRKEAYLLSLVNNDAIVRYYEFARDEADARYLVMEFVDGQSLERILQDKRFDTPDVILLLKRLAQGLAAAYDHGIRAHRDLSPANILLPEGLVSEAKVIDFGIAKAADAGGVTLIGSDFAGKYSYASPEQVGLHGSPDQVDQRSDIYSLALVMAAAAIGFGKKLNMGTEPASVTVARQTVPDLSAVPAELHPILTHMLEPRPEDRFQTMREVLDEIDRLETGAGAPARTTRSVPVRPAGGGLARLWPWGLGIVAAAAAALGAVFVLTRPPAVTPDEVRLAVKGVVDSYSCADLSYSVGPDLRVTLTGFVPTQTELTQLSSRIGGLRGVAGAQTDVKVRAWPFCEAAALLKPLVGNSQSAAAALSLASAATSARVGAPLVLDARAPTFDSYAYIDYFTSGGQVLHLFPNDRDVFNYRPARNDFILGRPPQVGMQRCWTLSGDAGEQLVTYVASPSPLFATPRPAVENARAYLTALAQAVGNMDDGTKAGAMLFFDLRPADASKKAEQPCPAS